MDFYCIALCIVHGMPSKCSIVGTSWSWFAKCFWEMGCIVARSETPRAMESPVRSWAADVWQCWTVDFGLRQSAAKCGKPSQRWMIRTAHDCIKTPFLPAAIVAQYASMIWQKCEIVWPCLQTVRHIADCWLIYRQALRGEQDPPRRPAKTPAYTGHLLVCRMLLVCRSRDRMPNAAALHAYYSMCIYIYNYSINII